MRRWIIGISLFVCTLFLAGCFLTLTPKRDTMRTSIAKTTTRKTSEPLVVVSRPEETTTVIAPQESLETTVEYGKTEPVVAKRSIWTRWWWWLLILGGITYLGLWPLLIGLARKLKARTHALVSLVKQVDVYKDKAEKDPKSDGVDELKTILKAQDSVTKKEVDKIRNGG
jgi:hypothetical protein